MLLKVWKLQKKININCEICSKGKMVQYRNKLFNKQTNKILNFVHCDLAGSSWLQIYTLFCQQKQVIQSDNLTNHMENNLRRKENSHYICLKQLKLECFISHTFNWPGFHSLFCDPCIYTKNILKKNINFSCLGWQYSHCCKL